MCQVNIVMIVNTVDSLMPVKDVTTDHVITEDGILILCIASHSLGRTGSDCLCQPLLQLSYKIEWQPFELVISWFAKVTRVVYG